MHNQNHGPPLGQRKTIFPTVTPASGQEQTSHINDNLVRYSLQRKQ